MAREFKDFDKKYAKFAGTAIKAINDTVGGNVLIKFQQAYIAEIRHWPHLDRFTEDYSQSSIQYAVYEAAGAEDWQKFRVSLKGLTTREKLYALSWYWNVHIADGAGSHVSTESWSREIIRVNNYLGALKRGGQLDSQLRVIKG